MADNNNSVSSNSNSNSNNDSLDNQARQKQDIKRLLAGQSVSPPPASTVPTSTTTSKSDASPSTTTPQPLREDKLKLAVSFLSSPKVQAADKSKKTAFLKQKGLTDAEVEEAYRRTSGSNDNGTPVSVEENERFL